MGLRKSNLIFFHKDTEFIPRPNLVLHNKCFKSDISKTGIS